MLTSHVFELLRQVRTFLRRRDCPAGGFHSHKRRATWLSTCRLPERAENFCPKNTFTTFEKTDNSWQTLIFWSSDQCSYFALKLAKPPLHECSQNSHSPDLENRWFRRTAISWKEFVHGTTQGAISLTSHLSLHAIPLRSLYGDREGQASRQAIQPWQAWVIEKPATQARAGRARDVDSVFHYYDILWLEKCIVAIYL